MKPSPLRLKWVAYPAASYNQVDGYSGMSAATLPDVEASVNWCSDLDHLVRVKISSPSSHPGGYDFTIQAVAIFTFDLDLATKEYRTTGMKLAGFIATNIVRIMYSGAREQLAMITARGAHGPAMLDSLLLEPSDVQVGSNEPPEQILREVFRVPEEELAKLLAEVETASADDKNSGVTG